MVGHPARWDPSLGLDDNTSVHIATARYLAGAAHLICTYAVNSDIRSHIPEKFLAGRKDLGWEEG